MSTFAVVSSETNICDNVIVLDDGSSWNPPSDHYIINIDGEQVGIGWMYDKENNQWIEPTVLDETTTQA
jgi:hypothetical protein